ncbi:MAG: thiamine pyrophosphate-dependent enzyme, partial [Pseudomonadales bacterium]
QGDVRATLEVMTSMADTGSHPDWVATVQGYVSEWKACAAGHYNSEALPMRPERLCKELTDNLPSDSILVSDTGHAGIWTGTMIDLMHPEQSYIRCAGSLGWGIPAAIGAQCAAPDRPVVCFIGDGGAWYHLSEIETAVRCNIPAVFIINNNASLNQEKEINEWVFGEPTAACDSMWKLSDVDFSKMAESMGALGIQVTKPGDIGSALDRAISARRPAVIEVKTDINGIAPPPWLPN